LPAVSGRLAPESFGDARTMLLTDLGPVFKVRLQARCKVFQSTRF
jgi:hypothetical protein